MAFFKKVPRYGDLEIDKVLFLFDNMPMILYAGIVRKNIFYANV